MFDEGSLRRILSSYFNYYHRSRTHLSLEKDSPEPRPIRPPEIGPVVALPQVGGLHHRYQRQAAGNTRYVLAISGRPLCLHLRSPARSENLFISGMRKPANLVTVLMEDPPVRHTEFSLGTASRSQGQAQIQAPKPYNHPVLQACAVCISGPAAECKPGPEGCT